MFFLCLIVGEPRFCDSPVWISGYASIPANSMNRNTVNAIVVAIASSICLSLPVWLPSSFLFSFF